MTKTNILTWMAAQPGMLESRDFAAETPGTVLEDFQTLLSLIGEQGLAVTPAHLFNAKALEAINQSLARPLELGLKRPQQKSYPHINGLYLLLRASGLALVDVSGKKPHLRLDPEVLTSWSSLNPAERYFELLKGWWGRPSEEVIGEGSTWESASMKIDEFARRFPKTGTLAFASPKDSYGLRYTPGLHNLALLELFGLVDVRPMPRAEGQGWEPAEIRLTEWGVALLGHFMHFVRQALSPDADRLLPGVEFEHIFDPSTRFEQWSRLLRPSIQGWHRALEIPGTPFRPSQHLFKVSLGADCWRRIAASGETDMETFAAAILDAFDFDEDHLYRFSYRDRFGRTRQVDHPAGGRVADATFADETKIGELPLSEGMRIGFLFDFGDSWHFELLTESLDAGPPSAWPQVIEEHGKAPEQYADDEGW